MKRVHNPKNWAPAKVRAQNGEQNTVLMYRHAKTDAKGFMYPAPTWSEITRAFEAAKRLGLQSKLPQVWCMVIAGRVTKYAQQDNNKVVGAVWEICHRWTHGLFEADGIEDDAKAEKREALLEPIRELVCKMHQHLGKQYDQFVTE